MFFQAFSMVIIIRGMDGEPLGNSWYFFNFFEANLEEFYSGFINKKQCLSDYFVCFSKYSPSLFIGQISHWQNYILIKTLTLSPSLFRIELPDLANKNMGCPVKFKYYVGRSYTKN